MFSLDMIDFSDEEGYGKFLDLHEVYDMYINLKQMEVWSAVVCIVNYQFIYVYIMYRKSTILPTCKHLKSCLNFQKTRRIKNINGISLYVIL